MGKGPIRITGFYLVLQVYWFVIVCGEVSILSTELVGIVRKCPGAGFSGKVFEIVKNEQILKDDNFTSFLRFEFETEDVECPDPSEIITLSISIQNTSLIFSEDGHLKINKTYYSPKEFCVQSKSSQEFTVKLCNSGCSESRPCIRKCCELDQVWDMSGYEKYGKIVCRPSGPLKWSPFLYRNQNDPISQEKLERIEPRIISNHPKNWCDGQFSILTLRQFGQQDVTPFKILEDGSVLEKVSRTKWDLMSKDKFCIDGAQNFPLESGLSGFFSGGESETIVLDCRGFQEEIQYDSIESGQVYVFAMGIAILFLLLTISSHVILWRKQNIHGWTLMGYVLSLLVQFAFLICARVIGQRGTLCTLVAIGSHFATLSTFAWLTTMNFDVWLTFKTMNPSPGRSHELKRFCFYAFFAMTIPITIVIVALVLDHVYGEDPYSEVIVPGYGQEKCGLDRSGELPYLFGPILVLLTSNLLFIFTTLYYVYRNQKILKSNGLKTKILKHKIRFFGMLFLTAGVTWIFDVLSWATTSSKENQVTPWYWIFFDLVNILQAIVIFIIFVCNPQTLSELQQEIPCFSKLSRLWSGESKSGKELSRKMSHTQLSNVPGVSHDLELK